MALNELEHLNALWATSERMVSINLKTLTGVGLWQHNYQDSITIMVVLSARLMHIGFN